MNFQFTTVIKSKEAVTVNLQLCEPYPSGSATATANPYMTSYRFRLRPDFFIQGALPPGYQVVKSDYFEAFIGDTVPATITWNATLKRWESTPRPKVPLSASYSQSTGIISISIPFGSSFQRLPSDEFNPAYSPRTYGILVLFNGIQIANGVVEIAENINDPPPPAFPKVCSAETGSGSGSPNATGNGQSASPWVVGG